MKANYHTSTPNRQSRVSVAQKGLGPAPRVLAPHSFTPRRLNLAAACPGPILVGDREMLRKLRAAEMAAWEAVPPNTATEQAPAVRQDRMALWRLAARGSHLGEASSFFLVAACGAVAVLVGVQDLSELLIGWSQFVWGIRNLLGSGTTP